MNLFLINEESRNLNEIISLISEEDLYILVNVFETIETLNFKLNEISDEKRNSITNLRIIFDNLGNKCPLFSYTSIEIDELSRNEIYDITSSNYSTEEGMVLQEDIRSSGEGNINIASQFIQSDKFYSDELISVIEYIKSICDNLTNVNIISKFNSIILPELDLSHLNLEVEYEESKNKILRDLNIISQVYGPRAVPLDGKIYTPEDLISLMMSTNTTDMSRSYTLMNDIDMNGIESESIGKIGFPFTGIFDGSGYTITINETKSESYFGLFLTTQNSTIKNLNLKYVCNSISLTTNPTSPDIFLGGLCGYGLTSTFENCSVLYEEEITLSFNNPISINKNLFIGGVFGYLNNTCIVNNCNLNAKNNFTISVNYLNNSANRPIFIGGFAGLLELNTVLNTCSCLFEGNVNINNTISNFGGFIYIGGFIGEIFNKSNASNVTLEVKGQFNILNERINNGSSPTSSYLGGVVGFVGGGVLADLCSLENFTIKFNNVVNINSNTSISTNYIGIGFGFFQYTNLNNLSLICLDNIIFTATKTSITSRNTFCGGLVGFCNAVSTVNNININIQVLNLDIINNKGPISFGMVSGQIIGQFSNINIISYDINVKVNKNNSLLIGSPDNVYLGGLGPIFLNVSIMNNISMTCNSLTFDIIESGFCDNMYISSSIPRCSSSEFLNVNLSVLSEYNLICNINHNVNTPLRFYLGGAYGLIDNSSINDKTIKDSTTIVNNYTQNLSINESNPGNITLYNGGLCGYLDKTSTGNLTFENSSIFFGATSSMSCDLPSSYAGGVIGGANTDVSVFNCVAVYNDYTINANTFDKNIALNNGTTSNVSAISYGSPIDLNGVQDMDGYLFTNQILEIFNSSNNTQWISFLLKFRQSLEPSISPSDYVSSILLSDTATPLFYRNAAIQNSMSFLNLNSITIPFSSIKSSLQNYSSDIQNSQEIKYIIPVIYDEDIQYYQTDKGIYYLFNNYGLLNLYPEYNENNLIIYESSLSPPGILFDDNNFKEINGIYETPNKDKIKVLGVGSALIKVGEDKKEEKKSSSWWWITIIIVISVILCIVIFVYFLCKGCNIFDFIFNRR
jgi:hypothetical protein